MEMGASALRQARCRSTLPSHQPPAEPRVTAVAGNGARLVPSLLTSGGVSAFLPEVRTRGAAPAWAGHGTAGPGSPVAPLPWKVGAEQPASS